MTAANSGNRTLKLIEGRPMDALRGTEGGRSAAAKDTEAMDLARDMALMYRAALLRDLPCDKRPASSSCVRLDENTDIPVRDLDDAVAQFNSNEPKAAHDKHDTRFSCFLTLGVPITRGSIGTTRACPGPDAAMSRWVEWLDDVFGLNIPFLADPAQFEDMSTPGALSACVHRSDPAKLPFQAALTLLALGVPIHPNLSGGSGRRAGPQLLWMLTDLCQKAVKHAHLRKRVGARPAVVAARMSLMRCNEDCEAAQDTETLRTALAHLERGAPQLLAWVSRRNQYEARLQADASGSMLRTPGWLPAGLHSNIFLPRVSESSPAVDPAHAVTHAVVAGACLTVLKAAFSSRADGNKPPVFEFPGTSFGACGSYDVKAELNQLAQNICLARSLGGGFFPSESQADLRFGEDLAIEAISAHLQNGFGPVRLNLSTFDGKTVTLRRKPFSSQIVRGRAGEPQLHVVSSPAFSSSAPPLI